LNVFIIPSWYPSNANSIGGIFVKEQAIATAKTIPGIQIIVSCWGHESTNISFRSFKKIYNCLKFYLSEPRLKLIESPGFCEIIRPTLTFSRRLPFRTLDRLIEANKKNLEESIKRFGKVDVIHAHVSYPAGYIAYILSKEFDIPYVLMECAGPFPGSFSRNGKPIIEIEKAFKFASQVIAISNSMAHTLEKFGYSKITVLPYCINENLFSLGKPTSRKFIFSTLCGLDKIKGVDILLRAIALWNPSSDDIEFRIGGIGEQLNNLQQLAKNLNISHLINWLGKVERDKVPNFFKQTHVFVMASRGDTFGMVYVEAIASGKPIIATKCGGPEDIVSEINGILVNVDDVNQLSSALKKMYKDWNLYDPIKIRNEFISKFSAITIAEKLNNIYIKVTKKFIT
jgi:glycosyltransferase involved in cell wall biosynthesis